MSAMLKSTNGISKSQRNFTKTFYFVGMSILFSGLINFLLPARFFYCIAIIIAILIGYRTVPGHTNRNYLLIPLIFFSSATLYVSFMIGSSPVIKEALIRLTILFPLSVIFGYVVAQSHKLDSFISGYSRPVYLVFLLMPYELLVAPLLPRNAEYNIAERLGLTRASFFVEHPLILGTHLALIVSLLILNISPRSRVFNLFLVIAAISTLSLGPIVIILLLLTLKRFTSINSIGKYLVTATISCIALFLFLAVKGVSSNITTLSTFGISFNYRAIIYGNVLPSSLSENPIGFGIAGLQKGLYRVNLNNYSVDISRSIDSQPALLILQGGWLLLIPYLVLCLFLMRRAWASDYRAYPALISILLGFFVPIQAFTSTCLIQGVLFGIAFTKQAHVKK